jgi:large subunit ribosomal protein L4
VVFGPHPRSYEQRLPRKMKRLALRGALTAKLGDEAIKVIDTFALGAIKTRELAAVLGALEARGRILVVAPGRDERLELSARNLPTVEIILADSLNVVDLLKADIVLIEQPALARMEEVYA